MVAYVALSAITNEACMPLQGVWYSIYPRINVKVCDTYNESAGPTLSSADSAAAGQQVQEGEATAVGQGRKTAAYFCQ